MDAQTVCDSWNKYRYGVKIGNYNEETFGVDLVSKELKWKTPESVMKGSYGIDSTVYNKNNYNKGPFPQKEEQNTHMGAQMRQKMKGEDFHILFGHGITYDTFKQRDFKTISECSYNRKDKNIIDSKYFPNQTRTYLTYKSNEGLDGPYQKNILQIGEKDDQKKKYKHYDEFCKKFDATYQKTGLRK